MKLSIFPTNDSLTPHQWFSNVLTSARNLHYEKQSDVDIVDWHRMYSAALDSLLNEFHCRLHNDCLIFENEKDVTLFLLRFS